MEQPLTEEKRSFFVSTKTIEETISFAKLAFPMFFSQLALALIGLNSVVQAGNYSPDVLAGILMANSLWFPLFLGLGGIIFFVTPMVAQLYGANKMQEIGPLVRQAIWLVFPIVLLGVLLLSLGPSFLKLVGVDEGIIEYSKDYLSTFIFAIPAILLMQPLRSLSEGITKPVPIAIINFILLGMAIIGNYCFIFGNFGFPEMGARGAGLSAIIGTWTALTILIVYLRLSANYKHTQFFSRFDWPSLSTIKEILKGGLPLAASNFIELSMFSGATLVLGSLGSQVVASHGIAINIGGLLFMVPLSIGMAAAVRVGNKVGERDFQAARYSSFYSLKFGGVLALFNTLFLLLFAELVVTSIWPSDPAVIELAVILLMFAAFFQIPDSLAMCGMGSLRGYKDTVGPMIIMLVAYWMFALPFGYSLAITDFWTIKLGAQGMWVGMCIGLVIASALMIWRLNYTTNRYLTIRYEN